MATTITGITSHRNAVLNLPAADVINEFNVNGFYYFELGALRNVAMKIISKENVTVNSGGNTVVYDVNLTGYGMDTTFDDEDVGHVKTAKIGIITLSNVLTNATFIKSDNWTSISDYDATTYNGAITTLLQSCFVIN